MNTYRRSTIAGTLFIFLLGGVFCLPGCRGVSAVVNQAEREAFSELPYPEQAEVGPALDVHVERDGREIRVINLTPRPLGRVQIWLNAEYVRVVEGLPIGTTELSLPRWVNQYSEPYPVGTLLSPDRNQPLALAELYDPQTGLRQQLVVRRTDDKRATGSLTTSGN